MYRFALYASNHGYGHATRMAALASALLDYGIYVYVCTNRPKFLYADLGDENWQYRECRIDGGVVHGQNLKADIPATKAMLLELFAQREEIVAKETKWLRDERIDLVIADIPYFIVEACGYAGVPAFAVSNFDWAFIYNDLFQDDADMRIVVNTIFGLYRRLDHSYVPSLGTSESVPGFREPQYTGLLARGSSKEVSTYNEPVLSIMFGGEGDIEVDFEQICAAWDGIVLSTARHCQALNHRRVEPEDDFLAIIKSSDLVLCKPGYSTFAEILSCGKPMLFIPRKNYPEERVLIGGVQGYPSAREIDTLPDSEEEWRALFKSMPKVGQRVEAANAAIVGKIFSDFLSLKVPNARLMSVFDMGSNNLNYCLWDGASRSIVHRLWISTRLARNFAEGRLKFNDLSAEIPALKALLQCDAGLASEKHLIATGICRKADNAGELVEKLSAQWNLNGKIIAAKDEMKYAWAAAAPTIPSGQKALVFDIGGSSTELVWRPYNRAFKGASLDLGLISLKQSTDPEKMILDALGEIPQERFDIIIGVGLTATFFAKLVGNFSTSEVLVQSEILISLDDLQNLIRGIERGSIKAQQSQLQDAMSLSTMQLAAMFSFHLLDRFGLSYFMVCNDGISVGYARWKTK